MKLTQEMIRKFATDTGKHKVLVAKYIERVPDEYLPKSDKIKRAIEHDVTKFNDDEFTAYAKKHWASLHPKMRLTPAEKREIDKAKELHYKRNRHHPEHFDTGKFKDMVDATRMSIEDLAEMVADWCAESEEFGTDPREFAKKNIGKKWYFSGGQESVIYDLIDAIWSRRKS